MIAVYAGGMSKLQPGVTFGRWTLVEEVERQVSFTKWLCRCECGTERPVSSISLYTGASKSCGCARKLVRVVDGKRECASCKRHLDVSSFWSGGGRGGKRRNISWCKDCCYEKRLMWNYGLTLEQYEAMRRAAGFKCEICGKPESENNSGKLYIDHCHSTGVVRGLLCNECNSGLGRFRDSEDLLLGALAYMKKARDLGNKHSQGAPADRARIRRQRGG